MNKRRIILLFLICVAIGVGIVAQARITNGMMLYVAPSTVDDYKAMVAGEKQNLENINAQIEEAEERLAGYERDLESEESQAILENIESDYVKYGVYTGKTTVKGPGVIITVDDGKRDLYEGEDINNLLVHDVDILLIINDLKSAGAEAVSVNGQRILPTTSINCAGYTVRINGVTYARPFEIEAIGNARRMSSVLLGPEGYGTNLKEWGVSFTLETSDEVVIEGSELVDEYSNKYSKTI